MTARFVLTLQVGPDRLVIGPPGAFGGRPDGRLIGRPSVNGREDPRRWILRACQEPGALIRLRQSLILWTGDAHHINRLSERDLPERLATLCARGDLVIWASRPMGGHDAHTLAQVALQTGARGPIDTWSIGARIETTLRLVPDHLSAAARPDFEKLLSREALRPTVSVLSLWVSGHAFGASEVIDVILQALATHPLRRSLRDIADKITDVLDQVIAARLETDLREAARHLAQLVTLIGVPAFVALIAYASSKASKGALKARKAPIRRGPATAA